MKNSKNIFLSVLLGGLVLVTAIAGIVTMTVKKNNGEELRETINETVEEYLWGSVAETKPANTNVDNEAALDAGSTEAEISSEALALEETEPVIESEPDNMEAAAQENVDAVQEGIDVPQEGVAAEGEAGQPAAAEEVISLVFSEGDKLKWPVSGSVILEYSMDTTVYFPTLKQYKCNPGMLIQSEPGTAVVSPANALINEVGYDDEIGGYVSMSLGNGYELVCGQLNEICVSEGAYILSGAPIGITAEPTSYYIVEGSNVYLEMTKDDAPVDPLDFLE